MPDNEGDDMPVDRETKEEVEGRKRRFMDWCAKVWLYFGDSFGVRPVTIIGVTLGAIILTGLATYGAVTSSTNRDDIEKNTLDISEVQDAFCNGQAPPNDAKNNKLCNDLLKQLLENPNEANVERLKEVVRSEQ